MTLQNINNTYPNSQEKSLNGVLNINNNQVRGSVIHQDEAIHRKKRLK